MSEKSIVYWASPIEVASLKNSAENMVTNNLVKTRLILDKILDNINTNDKVAVKVHVGEAHNTRYLRHDYVREVIRAIKSKGGIPTLVETHGLGNNIETLNICEDYSICVGHRKSTLDHQIIAQFHGYTEEIVEAPLKFIDGEEGFNYKRIKINGIHFEEVSVAEGLFEFDKFVVISHFKGHPQAGFGGALKQLGIGTVSKRNKHLAHFDNLLTINTKHCDLSLCKQECIDSCPTEAITIIGDSAVIDSSLCVGCFRCTQKCPIKRAIKGPKLNEINIFVERFVDNATAVINSFGPEKIRYINFALDIPLMCDCVPNAGMAVVPDLGIFGSSDPVAIDKACYDAEINAPGLPIMDKDGNWLAPLQQGVEKFKALLGLVNPSLQFDAAIRNKIGNEEYELIKI
ncbi:MAG: DUF362 domain-containing protein [Candidatus Heimdallarchaeota archaeon]